MIGVWLSSYLGVGSCFAQDNTNITKQALMEPTVEAKEGGMAKEQLAMYSGKGDERGRPQGPSTR